MPTAKITLDKRCSSVRTGNDPRPLVSWIRDLMTFCFLETHFLKDPFVLDHRFDYKNFYTATTMRPWNLLRPPAVAGAAEW